MRHVSAREDVSKCALFVKGQKERGRKGIMRTIRNSFYSLAVLTVALFIGANFTLPASNYPSNTLWLSVASVSNGLANLILHGTTPGTNYTLLSKQALTDSYWNTARTITGAANQNWTPVSVPLGAQSSCFFQAQAAAGQTTTINLWIAQVGISSGNLVGIVSNSQADITYEIQSLTDLTQADAGWGSEGFILGSKTANWTPMSVAQNGRANLFLRIRSWADSTGSGIPDWWWLEYFGQTTNVNPYALDPAGDGYTDLQKFQLGLNPTNFTPPAVSDFIAVLSTNGTNVMLEWDPSPGSVQNYALGRFDFNWTTYNYDFTPIGPANGNTNSFDDVGAISNGRYYQDTYYQIQAVYTNGASQIAYAWWIQSSPSAPSGITVSYNANTGAATISWQPSPGNVTGYTILRQNSSGSGFTAIATVPGGQTSYVDNSYPGGYDVEYEVEANYAQGSSSPSDPENPRTNPGYTVPAFIVRGSQGALYLIVAGIPQNVTVIRIYRTDSQAAYYPISSFVEELYYNEFVTNSIYSLEESQFFDSGVGNGYFDVPVTNLVNGIYQLTGTQVPPYGTYSFQAQALASDGKAGGKVSTGRATGDLGRADYNIPFFDGRIQIAQNINFLLRETQINTPFSMGAPGFLFYGYSYSGHSDYVYAGFHFYNGSPLLNEFQPFEENNYYKNFCFAPANIDSGGALTTGVNILSGYGDSTGWHFPYVTYFLSGNPPTTYFFDTYSCVSGASQPSFTPVLDNTTAQWIFFGYNDMIEPDYGTNYFIPAENNIYGLPLISMKWPPLFSTASPGTSGANTAGNGAAWFFQFTQPILASNSYYFARHYIDPLPGEPNFNVTNTTPLLFASVGQPFSITAWAKQSLQNGYSGKFAYAEQYFDKAYLADSNGNITTNQTGILSEYGEFFPTKLGAVILTTKPDGALGTVGQCTVNVLGMGVDANHDGTVDTSFAGRDNTSQANPMVWWINNDHDWSEYLGDPGEDLKSTPEFADYTFQNIPSQRDLEDWARLWICGMPALTNAGYQVTLSWNVSSGNPAVNLVNSVEANGGIGYLTNATVAAAQTAGSTSSDPSYIFAKVTPGQSYTFPNNFFTNNANKYFLFEGAGIGGGELVLTVSQNGNTIAQTGVWLDLHDVQDFFEQNIIQDSMSGAKSNWTSYVEKVLPAISSGLGNDTNLIVLVHGINVRPWDCVNDAETVYKRLYWAGFQGKFAEVEWPCNLLTPIPDPLSPAVFNDSELQGYKASTALTTCLNGLKTRFPNYRLNILAHSQGNTVVSEAIKNGAPFDTYILTQGALPDSAYDVNAPVDTDLTSQENGEYITPEWQPMGYRGVYTNSNFAGRVVNFYNPNDPVLDYWVTDQKKLKPTYYFSTGHYYYDGMNSYFYPALADPYLVTDPEESRADVSRSRTLPIGQSGPASAHGVIKSAVDLHANFGFYNAFPDDHSAQWTWPIQTTLPYYQQILLQTKPAQ